MLRGGWTADHVEQFVRVVCIYAHDHEPDTRIRAVRDTAIKVEAGDKVSGWPSLADIIE